MGKELAKSESDACDAQQKKIVAYGFRLAL